MQASSEVGKVGGRNTRAAEGDLAAQEAGKISKSKGSSAVPRTAQAVRRRDDPLLPPLDPLPPADRLQRGAHPRGRNRPGDVLPLLQAVRTGHRRELLRRSPPRDAARRRRLRPRRRPAAGRRRRATATGSSKRWTTTSTRAAAIGVLFDLVRRLNKFVDDEKLEEPASRRPRSSTCCNAGRQTLARTGRRRWACSASRRRKQPRRATTTWPAS